MFGRFEQRQQPLMSRPRFARRVGSYVGFALMVELMTICLGAIGYHSLEQLSWLDSALNAAMVITGNGPAYPPQHAVGKVFQIAFSLVGAVVFALVVTAVLAPVFHRVLHTFHLASNED